MHPTCTLGLSPGKEWYTLATEWMSPWVSAWGEQMRLANTLKMPTLPVNEG